MMLIHHMCCFHSIGNLYGGLAIQVLLVKKFVNTSVNVIFSLAPFIAGLHKWFNLQRTPTALRLLLKELSWYSSLFCYGASYFIYSNGNIIRWTEFTDSMV